MCALGSVLGMCVCGCACARVRAFMRVRVCVRARVVCACVCECGSVWVSVRTRIKEHVIYPHRQAAHPRVSVCVSACTNMPPTKLLNGTSKLS